ncbi:MAG: LysM peptidoglycan-binding domain-containing protein [Defluviitaleaceae bacterium]|nr:LysM peptidoglycan-binding domain-containing protein [Defluviitaleaceae bacterium]
MKEFDENNKENIGKEHKSMEDFARQAVESLFDDKPKKAEETAPPSAPPPLPSVQGEEFKMPAEAPYRERLRKDPETEYAEYISSAREANRREQEVKEVKQEAYKKQIDKQLDEMARISGGKKKEPLPAPDPTPQKAEKWEEHEIKPKAPKPAKPAKPQSSDHPAPSRKPQPPVNMGNLAIVGVFVLLIAFALAMWQAVSVNSRLSYAEEQLAELQLVETHLRTHNTQLEQRVEELEAELQAQASGQFGQGQTGGGDFPGGPLFPPAGGADSPPTGDTTPPPGQTTNWANTHRNGANQLVYTVQSGDGLWGIATHFFGSGTYMNQIMQANGLTNEAIHPGDELIIPGL